MHLNVVAFQVPYPPDYGGVIDVYYRLKALKEIGVKIILHCFYYDGRSESSELEALTESVFYYKRPVGLKYQFSTLPYIVRSRCDRRLLENLCDNDYPILFEGLHCCYYLNHPVLKNRQKWVRMHNIEHDYYSYLAKSTNKTIERLFFKIESIKLKRFERILRYAQAILAISEADSAYFKNAYPDVRTLLLPACYAETDLTAEKCSGNYCLYHANFAVSENVKVAEYLIRNIVGKVDMPFYIAGHQAENLTASDNVRIFSELNSDELRKMVTEAKVNLLVTFQPTGMKIKLLNALNWGGFCVVNSKMLTGTNLASTCIVADSDDEIINCINDLKNSKWTSSDEELRQRTISPYSNRQSVRTLMSLNPVGASSAVSNQRHF